MAELLVRVVDKINKGDFYKNCQCTKRGDVIVVCEDGWPWGKEELINPDWRILKVPGMSVSEANQFLDPELPIDGYNPSKTLQRRAFKIDLDRLAVLDNNFQRYLLDVKRNMSAIVLNDKDALLDVKTAKAPIPDPAFFGDDRTVIG